MKLSFYKRENMSRREFVQEVTKWGTSVGLSPIILEALGAFNTADAENIKDDDGVDFLDDTGTKFDPKANRIEVKHYDTVENNEIRCHVCARDCHLPEGKTCFCYCRVNHGGKLYNYAFNNPCIVRIDPIEKGPFSHFLPNTTMLSVATAGCMLRCMYCQNWQVSQARPSETNNMEMDKVEVVKRLSMTTCKTIAYTYTEPIAFYEYMYDVARYAHRRKIRNVMVSSGYMREQPLKELFPYIDAFCITLKGFTDEFYRKVLGARLAPVLKVLELIRDSRKWLEVPVLIVPTYNDDMKVIKNMCRWIVRNLGSNVPVHFARFIPKYKLRNLPQTPIRTLENARNIAQDVGIKFAYISNVPGHKGNNTYCPNCHRPIIQRVGFKLIGINMSRGHCRYCKTRIPGVWK